MDALVVSNKRNVAIDILKFMAVFLVMNSHMELCYPKYQFLATGGAIGDALFFFASGFTLFLGRDLRFDAWYKRRISRIYPSIIACAIVAYVVWRFEENIGDILIGKRYWFIGCILIYYVFLYPLKKIKSTKLINWVFLGWLGVSIVAFFVVWKAAASPWQNGIFRNLIFFVFMLQGAIMGRKAELFVFKWWHIPLLLFSAAIWFLLVHIGTGKSLIILSIFPLLCFTYSLYCLCNAKVLSKLYSTSMGGVIFIISQLCLEVYLIQKFVFTDAYNGFFPLNVPVIMLVVILAAYCVKVLAELLSQTFKTEPYNWKRVLLWYRY